MKRLMAFCLGACFLAAGCSNNEAEGYEEARQESKADAAESSAAPQTGTDIVKTKDGITFKIIDNAGITDKKKEQFKLELSDAYNKVRDSILTDYEPAKRITIYLEDGSDASWGFKNEVVLYGIRNNQHPLVHELTHSLLGYGSDFGSDRGYFTQEGYAVYMENQYGKTGYPAHKVVNYLASQNKRVPLEKLISKDTDDQFFRHSSKKEGDIALQWISYTEAGSFITYLIDVYGLERFEKIYNQDNLEKKLYEVYGKNSGELEQEWLQYIEENAGELSMPDKMNIPNFYYVDESLSAIDSKYFK